MVSNAVEQLLRERSSIRVSSFMSGAGGSWHIGQG